MYVHFEYIKLGCRKPQQMMVECADFQHALKVWSAWADRAQKTNTQLVALFMEGPRLLAKGLVACGHSTLVKAKVGA